MKFKRWLLIVICIVIGALPLAAQQKGQYMPGQFALNAEILAS